MASNPTQANQRNYLAKDFTALRADLLRYSQTFFPDRIQDFSETSLGGLLIDLAASVGDTLTYYLDHQFKELSWSDAVELSNIERHIRNNGVKITGASPATVELTVFVEVPSELVSGIYVPERVSLPVIEAGSVFSSNSSIDFTTLSNVDFGARDSYGLLLCNVETGDLNDDGTPASFILSAQVSATSSIIATETFTISNGFNPYLTISLSNQNVSEILSVTDTEGNEYYEVDSLTQDTVYKTNQAYDSQGNIISQNLELVSAPRRFMVNTTLTTRVTSLMFGGGDVNFTEGDAFPDPSRLAIPLYGGSTVNRFSVDPNSLLRSRTLGVAPTNTVITVRYRHGGGSSHNVSANSIRTVRTVSTRFPYGVSDSAASIRASIDVLNSTAATGGTAQPTVNELRQLIPSAKNSQLRIVTKQDLIARIYSMPSRFGKVVRAGVRSNPSNPLAKQLAIIGADSSGNFDYVSDSTKENIRTYINDMRLISDAIDVVDADIVNFQVYIEVVATPNSNSFEISSSVIEAVQNVLSKSNSQIDRPILISDVTYEIINVPGVLSLVSLAFESVTGTVDGRTYVGSTFDFELNANRGIIVPPTNGIFELRYPQSDIFVTVV